MVSKIEIKHEGKYFIASVISDKGKISTGIRGFQLMVERHNIPLILSKVEYNGIILNNKQKERLYLAILDYGKV